MTSSTTARVLNLEARIQELLEANNRYVEINRKLKDQLEADAELFEMYAHSHSAKGTPEADEKAERNFNQVDAINRVFEECKPN